MPAAAVPADSVKVELPLAEMLVALKPALAPAGTPLAERLMVPEKPLMGLAEMVELADAPCAALTLEGLALSEKSGVAVAVTVNDTAVVCVSVPLVPVTVTL